MLVNFFGFSSVIEDICFNLIIYIYLAKEKQSTCFPIKVDITDSFLLGKTPDIPKEMYWDGCTHIKICQVTFFYGEGVVREPRNIVLKFFFCYIFKMPIQYAPYY